MIIHTEDIRRPRCPACGELLSVGRRQPHPDKSTSELVIFNCLACRAQDHYEMDRDGDLSHYEWPGGPG